MHDRAAAVCHVERAQRREDIDDDTQARPVPLSVVEHLGASDTPSTCSLADGPRISDALDRQHADEMGMAQATQSIGGERNMLARRVRLEEDLRVVLAVT